MKIIKKLEYSNQPTSVALGYFDGIHLGHRAVINDAVEFAKKNNLVPTVFTLLQSPRKVLFNEKIEGVITISEKLQLIQEMGVGQVYIIDFTEIRNISAEDFVSHILKDCFHAKHAVCGFNYHFGKQALGNRTLLKDLCNNLGISTSSQNQLCYQNMPISSTRIRKCISDGDIISANAMLGRKYGFHLPVVHGRQLGRTWGTPTINQLFPNGLVCPKFGVYASEVTVDGKKFCGVTNIGVKPTIEDFHGVIIETWMPNYNGRDLYDELSDVRLIEYIRPEKKFDSLESLKNEILLNGRQAEQIFLKNQSIF